MAVRVWSVFAIATVHACPCAAPAAAHPSEAGTTIPAATGADSAPPPGSTTAAHTHASSQTADAVSTHTDAGTTTTANASAAADEAAAARSAAAVDLQMDSAEAALRLGQRLRQARQTCGLTLDDLAERAEVSVPTIRRAERGTRQPRLDTLRKLAAALGVSIGTLLTDFAPVPHVGDDALPRDATGERQTPGSGQFAT